MLSTPPATITTSLSEKDNSENEDGGYVPLKKKMSMGGENFGNHKNLE